MQDVPDSTSNTTTQTNANKERGELIPLYSNANDNGALRLIVAFFSGFTVTLTIALAAGIYYGKSQIVPHGGVTSDDETCSYIGSSIMKQGGNAVDAAVAVAFCIGVVNPHLTGLASGGFMLIYNHRDRKVVDSIDFRVTRSRDLGIGVPGFVAGLYMAHQLHGKLHWKTLIMPAYQIANNGFKVSPSLMQSKPHLMNGSDHNHELKQWLYPLSKGEVITNNELAETLLSIADKGPTDFYNKTLVNDLKPIEIDVDDIIGYKPLRGTWLKESYEHYDIIVPGKGSGGPFLIDNLSSLNNSLSPLLSVIEAFSNKMVNNWSLPYASNIDTMDGNDLYVSVVSGLGFMLGSQILTSSGFILNNILEITNDTSSRPIVLFTPVIAVQNSNVCGRRFVFGGGDVRDVAQALVYLLRNPASNVAQSIAEPRVRIIYPQIAVELNNRMSRSDYNALSEYDLIAAPTPYSSINVVQKILDDVTAVADIRGFGGSTIF